MATMGISSRIATTKYLSEKMEIYADEILETDGVKYEDIDEETPHASEIIDAVQENAVDKLGYFLKPGELFSRLAAHGATTDNLIEELERILAIRKREARAEARRRAWQTRRAQRERYHAWMLGKIE